MQYTENSVHYNTPPLAEWNPRRVVDYWMNQIIRNMDEYGKEQGGKTVVL